VVVGCNSGLWYILWEVGKVSSSDLLVVLVKGELNWVWINSTFEPRCQHVFFQIQVIIFGHPVHTAPYTALLGLGCYWPCIHYDSIATPTLKQGGQSDHTVNHQLT
jgi:hypothetical protein